MHICFAAVSREVKVCDKLVLKTTVISKEGQQVKFILAVCRSNCNDKKSTSDRTAMCSRYYRLRFSFSKVALSVRNVIDDRGCGLYGPRLSVSGRGAHGVSCNFHQPDVSSFHLGEQVGFYKFAPCSMRLKIREYQPCVILCFDCRMLICGLLIRVGFVLARFTEKDS